MSIGEKVDDLFSSEKIYERPHRLCKSVVQRDRCCVDNSLSHKYFVLIGISKNDATLVGICIEEK